MAKKTVFITGTSGSMGGFGLAELMKQRDKFDIVTLVRPSRKNKEAMLDMIGEPGIKIVWGDLTVYEDVLECVTGADYVVHPAAFIPPAADHDPDTAWKINVGSMENIVKAVKAQKDPDSVKVIGIGSVAETGDRLYPIHVGRCGDPLKPSVYDMYACSKIAAERVLAESGLKYWASCRQTYIAIPDTMSLMDPIMFHQPINTCIEFCTGQDAGRLCAAACQEDVPEEFWGKFYNVGGGEKARITFMGLMDGVFGLLGMGKATDIFERNWFTLRNFHCQWYEDSDRLEEMLHYRSQGFDEYLQTIWEGSPLYVKLPAYPGVKQIMALPIVKKALKKFMMEPQAAGGPDCTQYWINNNVEGRISSFYKSKEDWAKIPDWGVDMPKMDMDPKIPADSYTRLDHGYDESKGIEGLELKDLQGIAKFRGGELLSKKYTKGDIYTPLKWKCWQGHEFEATVNIIVRGGHFCPDCVPPKNGWNWDAEAKNNPFFAQVWYVNHDKDEANYYPPDCYKDTVGKK